MMLSARCITSLAIATCIRIWITRIPIKCVLKSEGKNYKIASTQRASFLWRLNFIFTREKNLIRSSISMLVCPEVWKSLSSSSLLSYSIRVAYILFDFISQNTNTKGCRFLLHFCLFNNYDLMKRWLVITSVLAFFMWVSRKYNFSCMTHVKEMLARK